MLNTVSKYFFRVLLSVFLCSASHALISPIPAQNRCSKLVVAVDTQWPPYGLKGDSGKIEGLSLEIIEKIFSELDIPVIAIEFTSKREVDHALSLGDIDMLLATYEYPKSQELLDFIRPGYLEDPYMVVLRQGEENGYLRFQDLIGHRGLNTQFLNFDTQFDDYRKKYLYIYPEGTLEDIFNLVAERKADYVLGSRYQLEYGLDRYNEEQKLVFVPEISSGASVYMAFSKASACHNYMAYVQKRLSTLKKAGVIEEILEKYVKKPDISLEALSELYDSKVDFGN